MKVFQRFLNLMNPCPRNNEFKRLHDDVKEKHLVFQDQERFPGIWTAGIAGEQRVQTHHDSFLSFGSWAQKVTGIPVILEVRQPSLVTSLRWQAWGRPDFLLLFVTQKRGRMVPVHLKNRCQKDFCTPERVVLEKPSVMNETTQWWWTWSDIQRLVWEKPLSTLNLWLKYVPSTRDREY